MTMGLNEASPTGGKPPLVLGQAPRMGTALRVFLCRYAADLQAFDEHYGDRITRQMIDCGEILLIEGERLGGRL